MEVRDIDPSGPLRGIVRLPGSKSYANRALICAALAPGRSHIEGAGACDDVRRMVENLRRCGVRIEAKGDDPEVEGLGGPPRGFSGLFETGDAGTVMRFLLPFLAAGEGRAVLDGTERMRRRPLGPLVEALGRLGARVDCEGGTPPVRLEARGLKRTIVALDGGESSQFASGLLLAAPAIEGGLEVVLTGAARSGPYLDMTVETMGAFGAVVVRDGRRLSVAPHPSYLARSYRVEGDASAGAFLLAAAAVTLGRVRVEGVDAGSRQGDVRIAALLEDAGCSARSGPGWIEVEGRPLRPFSVDLGPTPDLLAPLAAVGACAPGTSEIKGVPHARLKESDRIAALAEGLTRAGASTEETADGLAIEGRPDRLRGFSADPRGDHRLAMAFAVLGLKAPGMRIRDPGCVAKSFPDFFARLDSLRA